MVTNHDRWERFQSKREGRKNASLLTHALPSCVGMEEKESRGEPLPVKRKCQAACARSVQVKRGRKPGWELFPIVLWESVSCACCRCELTQPWWLTQWGWRDFLIGILCSCKPSFWLHPKGPAHRCGVRLWVYERGWVDYGTRWHADWVHGFGGVRCANL